MGKLKDGSEVTMVIKFLRKKKLGESISFYNVLMRSIMNCLGLVQFGRSCYDPEKKTLFRDKGYK